MAFDFNDTNTKFKLKSLFDNNRIKETISGGDYTLTWNLYLDDKIIDSYHVNKNQSKLFFRMRVSEYIGKNKELITNKLLKSA